MGCRCARCGGALAGPAGAWLLGSGIHGTPVPGALGPPPWRVGPLRPSAAYRRPAVPTAAPAPACTTAPHRTRWLLLRPDLARDATEHRYIERIMERCPQIAQARELV